MDVALDEQRREKLGRLAKSVEALPEVLASSLLSSALDEVDTNPDEVARLLDDIPGAYERALLGLQQGRSGQTVNLRNL